MKKNRTFAQAVKDAAKSGKPIILQVLANHDRPEIACGVSILARNTHITQLEFIENCLHTWGYRYKCDYTSKNGHRGIMFSCGQDEHYALVERDLQRAGELSAIAVRMSDDESRAFGIAMDTPTGGRAN